MKWSILFLFILSSCALFESYKLKEDVSFEIKKACLDADGSGRFQVDGHKYVFHFESALESEDTKWILGLTFPMHGQEIIELDWSESQNISFNSTFEERILREKKGVDPEKLHQFMANWARFMREVILLKRGELKSENGEFMWQINSKRLLAQKQISQNEYLTVDFSNVVSKEYFGKMVIKLENHDTDSVFKSELIVRKCLEKQPPKVN